MLLISALANVCQLATHPLLVFPLCSVQQHKQGEHSEVEATAMPLNPLLNEHTTCRPTSAVSFERVAHLLPTALQDCSERSQCLLHAVHTR